MAPTTNPSPHFRVCRVIKSKGRERPWQPYRNRDETQLSTAANSINRQLRPLEDLLDHLGPKRNGTIEMKHIKTGISDATKKIDWSDSAAPVGIDDRCFGACQVPHPVSN